MKFLKFTESALLRDLVQNYRQKLFTVPKKSQEVQNNQLNYWLLILVDELLHNYKLKLQL